MPIARASSQTLTIRKTATMTTAMATTVAVTPRVVLLSVHGTNAISAPQATAPLPIEVTVSIGSSPRVSPEFKHALNPHQLYVAATTVTNVTTSKVGTSHSK